jgi:hypothetical protein
MCQCCLPLVMHLLVSWYLWPLAHAHRQAMRDATIVPEQRMPLAQHWTACGYAAPVCCCSLQVALYYWPPLLVVALISVFVGLYHTFLFPRGVLHGCAAVRMSAVESMISN